MFRNEAIVLIQNQMQMNAKCIDQVLWMWIPNTVWFVAILAGDAMLRYFSFDI